jgi:hypothetical protein
MHELDLFVENLAKKYNSQDSTYYIKDLNKNPTFHESNSRQKLKYIYYVRYAGNFLVGLTGSRTFVDDIQSLINTFIKGNLHLDIKKSNVFSKSQGSLYFLGYLIMICTSVKKNLNNPKEALSRYKRRLLHCFQISNARLANSKVNSIKANLLKSVNSGLFFYRLPLNIFAQKEICHSFMRKISFNPALNR